MVNQYFAMGADADAKAGRLREANQFLQSPTLQQIMDAEGHANIESLEYSNVMNRLPDIIIATKMPTSLNRGVFFDMTDHTFDPKFSDKIKTLFSAPVKDV